MTDTGYLGYPISGYRISTILFAKKNIVTD